MKIHITYFFRKPRAGAFSIENLFLCVQKSMPENISFKNQFLSRHSSGLVNRFLLCLEAKKKQRGINHVTGDINFVALGLPPEKTILTIHDIESLERRKGLSNFLLNLFWLKFPVNAVSFVTVISQHTKQKLLSKVSVKPNKIVVIPNPVSSIYQYTPKKFSKTNPRLLQVGTKSNKNLERLIPALEGIPCTLIIVGALSTRHVELLQNYQVSYENKIGISNEELVQEYINSDIVVFVSLFEGFGLPIIEANAVGRAVMTSNSGAMAEVAADAAMLVDPLQVQDVKRGLLELIENDELREQLIKNGLENVKKYHPDTIARQYLDLYERLSS